MNSEEYFRSVEYYDIITNTWTTNCPEINTARFGHSSCSLDNYIYTFCGRNGTGILNSIELIEANIENYSLIMSQWELIQFDVESFQPRFYALVAPLN